MNRPELSSQLRAVARGIQVVTDIHDISSKTFVCCWRNNHVQFGFIEKHNDRYRLFYMLRNTDDTHFEYDESRYISKSELAIAFTEITSKLSVAALKEKTFAAKEIELDWFCKPIKKLVKKFFLDYEKQQCAQLVEDYTEKLSQMSLKELKDLKL